MTVRKSNVVASVARSFSCPGMQLYDNGVGHCLGTFGQIVCQFPGGAKLSLFGLHQVTKSVTPHLSFGAVTVPVGFLKPHRDPETTIETSAEVSLVPAATDPHMTVSSGSIAMKLEKELEENTTIDGWIEIKDLNNKQFQWAVNVSDASEDEFGWGMSVSGMFEGRNSGSRVQAESYIKLNLGKKFSLKPGIAYVVDGNARILGLMLRSNWSF
uniref:Uncharacterized protein n=1 Tax=Rhizophora mucronata TaxID=61149 RepID=A0A2P2N066_RHIMU